MRLVHLRILFGALAFLATMRTLIYGWVDKFYIQPEFHFKFFGLGWVEALPAWGMYGIVGCMLLASVGILLGYRYRWSAWTFFVLWVYLECIDATHYLNHYYLLSLMALWCALLPLHRAYSLDVIQKRVVAYYWVPRGYSFAIQLQLGLVYFFAAVAKWHTDWLVAGQPLHLWLTQRSDWPVVGSLFQQQQVAVWMSWAGMCFDLFIFFLLMWRPSRRLAYIVVIFFHLATRALFPIGVFPFLMIAMTTIMFSNDWHLKVNKKIILTFGRLFNLTRSNLSEEQAQRISRHVIATPKSLLFCMGLLMISQVVLPLRHHLYPGNVLWTEEGFRFSWRVMVVHKTGVAQFRVRDAVTQQESLVNNLDFLTEKQEYMMLPQPDFILQFAHHLGAYYQTHYGYVAPEVYADIRIALNGRLSRPFVDTTVNLMNERMGWSHESWILPFTTK